MHHCFILEGVWATSRSSVRSKKMWLSHAFLQNMISKDGEKCQEKRDWQSPQRAPQVASGRNNLCFPDTQVLVIQRVEISSGTSVCGCDVQWPPLMQITPCLLCEETVVASVSQSFACSVFNLTPSVLAAAFTGVLGSALPRAVLLCPSLVLQAPRSPLGTLAPWLLGRPRTRFFVGSHSSLYNYTLLNQKFGGTFTF